MKFGELYPETSDSYILQVVEGFTFRAIFPAPCECCKEECEFLSYDFARPAIPVCSHECLAELKGLAQGTP